MVWPWSGDVGLFVSFDSSFCKWKQNAPSLIVLPLEFLWPT